MSLQIQSATPRYGENYRRGYIGFLAEDTSDFVSQGIAYLTRWQDRSGIAVTHVLVVTGENECVEALPQGVVRSPLDPYFDSPRPIFLKAPVGCAVGESGGACRAATSVGCEADAPSNSTLDPRPSISISPDGAELAFKVQGSGFKVRGSVPSHSPTLPSVAFAKEGDSLTHSLSSIPLDKVEDKVQDKVAENALKLVGLPYGYGLIVTDCLANTLAGHFLNKCLAGWPNRLISKLADWNDLAPVCSVVAACALNPPPDLQSRLGLTSALGPIGCLAKNPARTITPQMLFEDREIFP